MVIELASTLKEYFLLIRNVNSRKSLMFTPLIFSGRFLRRLLGISRALNDVDISFEFLSLLSYGYYAIVYFFYFLSHLGCILLGIV